MARLVWTSRALHDVSRLYDFLAAKNPDAARRAANSIFERINPLAAHPGIGRPFEDTELRELFIPFGSGGYVVLYRHDSDSQSIVVLAIRHSREIGFWR